MSWEKTPMTREDCILACALRIYVKFEDGTDLDDTTIGDVVGRHNKLEPVDCTGLVEHLRQTDDIYPEVLAGGIEMAVWARDVWNHWIDRHAAPVGSWP